MTSDVSRDTIDAMRAEVEATWGEVRCGAVALRILDAFVADPDARDVGFMALAELVGSDLQQTVAAINVLSASSSVDGLDVGFLFEDGDNAYSLSKFDMAAAEKAGWILHPEDGRRVDDWEKRTYPVVNPSNRLKAALAAALPDSVPSG